MFKVDRKLEVFMENLGYVIGEHPWPFIIMPVVMVIALGSGFFVSRFWYAISRILILQRVTWCRQSTVIQKRVHAVSDVYKACILGSP
jgi:hypothetical protein